MVQLVALLTVRLAAVQAYFLRAGRWLEPGRRLTDPELRVVAAGQMIAWRILADTHSLTITVAMMMSRISEICVQ